MIDGRVEAQGGLHTCRPIGEPEQQISDVERATTQMAGWAQGLLIHHHSQAPVQASPMAVQSQRDGIAFVVDFDFFG